MSIFAEMVVVFLVDLGVVRSPRGGCFIGFAVRSYRPRRKGQQQACSETKKSCYRRKLTGPRADEMRDSIHLGGHDINQLGGA